MSTFIASTFIQSLFSIIIICFFTNEEVEEGEEQNGE